MKKLLSTLGAIGLIATSSSTVVSCGSDYRSKDVTVAWDSMYQDMPDLVESAIAKLPDFKFVESDIPDASLFDTKEHMNKYLHDEFEVDYSEANLMQAVQDQIDFQPKTIDKTATYYYVATGFTGDDATDFQIFDGEVTFS